jgi:hypothetical protein
MGDLKMTENNANEKMNKGCCSDFMGDKKAAGEMFEKMSSCCKDMINSADCSTIMKQMKDKFCGAKTK